MSSQLPRMWALATLGDIHIDESHSVNPAKTPDGLFELYSVPSFPSGAPEIILGRQIGSSKQSVAPGTVLLCGINPRINRVWIVYPLTNHTVIASTEWIPFFPQEGLSPKYLAYFLQQYSVRDFLAGRASGVGGSLMRVKASTLMDFPFPVAPTKEQNRIVAEIEKQLTRLDDAVAALKRAQVNLKRYRASVLKAACDGRLVPTEAELARRGGCSFEPASELLKRILVERRAKWEADQLAKMFAAGKPPRDDFWKKKYKEPEPPDSRRLPDLPKGWGWASVEQVGFVQLGRQRSPKHHQGKHMRPYLRVANVFEDRIDVSDVFSMNFTPEEFVTYELKAGDVLLNEGQSLELVGRPALYRSEMDGTCFQNTLVRFRAVKGVLPEYSLLVFLSYLHNQRFQQIAKWTTNIAHLGADRFAKLEFPLPPINEQSRIVAEWQQRSATLAHVAGQFTLNMLRAERLRQSVLKRAFGGRLVSQDTSDEPASVLLERIREERKPAEDNNMDVRRARRKRAVTAVEG